MLKILVFNDINDINKVRITHFSLDKGLNLARSFHKIGHEVYFLTDINDYVKDGIKYVSIQKLTDEFVNSMNYILISREALIPVFINKIPSFKKIIGIEKNARRTKIIVKSDSPTWFQDKDIRYCLRVHFRCGASLSRTMKWIVSHFDYICAQNIEYKKTALLNGMPGSCILISNMGVPNQYFDYSKISNPYDIKHSYCVNENFKFSMNEALLPRYYLNNPDSRSEFDVQKYIIVYTGRIKVNGGKIFYNMINIMQKLGGKYELHIFPGSFLMPMENGKAIACSAKNAHNLYLLRDTLLKDSKNIIIHYPFEHTDKYRYLHFAHCGIDFSDMRPNDTISSAGHAKILEYCEVGLPVVCEENINNLFLVRNGKNGIILPYMASDEEYVDAILNITQKMKIDREYCRKITVDNENWDIKAKELLAQLN